MQCYKGKIIREFENVQSSIIKFIQNLGPPPPYQLRGSQVPRSEQDSLDENFRIRHSCKRWNYLSARKLPEFSRDEENVSFSQMVSLTRWRKFNRFFFSIHQNFFLSQKSVFVDWSVSVCSCSLARVNWFLQRFFSRVGELLRHSQIGRDEKKLLKRHFLCVLRRQKRNG